jgi:hypothetical protein
VPYLRQELRELEILDDITRLRFEGVLPKHVTGLYRIPLLRSYQAWNGANCELASLHGASNGTVRWVLVSRTQSFTTHGTGRERKGLDKIHLSSGALSLRLYP